MLFTNDKLSDNEKKLVKFAAYDALINYNIRSLPVPLSGTCKIDDITILPMQFLIDHYGIDSSFYEKEFPYGIVMYATIDYRYLILYNEKFTSEEIRWSISQFLACIKLGYADKHPNELLDISDMGFDTEEFASHFSCPDIVLRDCNISNTSDIAKYCKIPFKRAWRKSVALKKGCENVLFRSLENKLRKNFSSFIARFKDRANVDGC